MNWIEDHKILTGVLVFVVLGGGLFFLFSGGGDDASGGQQLERETVTQPSAQSSSQLVQQLLEVRDITFNTEFFESEAFRSLRSTAQPLPTRNVGRRNPFEPVSPSQQEAQEAGNATPAE